MGSRVEASQHRGLPLSNLLDTAFKTYYMNLFLKMGHSLDFAMGVLHALALMGPLPRPLRFHSKRKWKMLGNIFAALRSLFSSWMHELVLSRAVAILELISDGRSLKFSYALSSSCHLLPHCLIIARHQMHISQRINECFKLLKAVTDDFHMQVSLVLSRQCSSGRDIICMVFQQWPK